MAAPVPAPPLLVVEAPCVLLSQLLAGQAEPLHGKLREADRAGHRPAAGPRAAAALQEALQEAAASQGPVQPT